MLHTLHSMWLPTILFIKVDGVEVNATSHTRNNWKYVPNLNTHNHEPLPRRPCPNKHQKNVPLQNFKAARNVFRRLHGFRRPPGPAHGVQMDFSELPHTARAPHPSRVEGPWRGFGRTISCSNLSSNFINIGCSPCSLREFVHFSQGCFLRLVFVSSSDVHTYRPDIERVLSKCEFTNIEIRNVWKSINDNLKFYLI